jgi:hypothetical protein
MGKGTCAGVHMNCRQLKLNPETKKFDHECGAETTAEYNGVPICPTCWAESQRGADNPYHVTLAWK